MIELGRGHAVSTASPDSYFALWTDHATWASWSPDTEWVKLDGPVRTGTRGTMKPKGGPRTRFVISVCRPGEEYTDTTLLPGAQLVFRHTAEARSNGTVLDVLVTVSGPLAFIWAKTLGAGFRDSAQADLDRLVGLAERAA
ncbi:SRPBCC family protein [Arthrobacter sp. UYEF20]|uniref:SRPBCC family protein n=1 Tax=Arthrobacter sp. UYEF20 TaxID=1756363 RepID=UPI0033923C51